MDDSRFDNSIKSKLQGYLHPVIDANALQTLHQQTAANVPASWYSRHRVELWIGSGLAIFLLIYLLDYMQMTQNNLLMEESFSTIQDQNMEIEKLRNEISQLQLLTPDTIRIVQIRDESYTVSSLLHRISRLEETNRELMKYLERDIHLFPSDENKMISTTTRAGESPTQQFSPGESENDSVEVAPKETESNPTQVKSLSAKSIRDIEKHYIRGVGIKIGPTAELLGNHYSLGDGHINLSGGILTEFIFSPSLGLEAGAKYSERYYAIHDEQTLTSAPLPDVDSQLGNLQRAEIDYRMLEIPLNLKYRYPITLKDHWLAGIGYSSVIYLNEDFEYTYHFDNQSPNPTSIISTTNIKGMKVYAGTVNISLGISHVLNNKKIIEGSLFYNHGIGTQGVEKTRAQFFGLRGIYWFTFR